MREMKKAVLIDIAENAEREKVVGVVKDLICDRENLIAALKVIDTDCKYCLHNQIYAPCQNIDIEGLCLECHLDCVCKTCRDNSNWVWCGEVMKNG